MIKAIVGAGGKTSLIKELAEKYLAEGKRVFVTTSTHMFIEENTLLTDDAETIIKELQKKNYVHAGLPEGKKIRSLSLATYEKVCHHADVVLIEADGSRHMPLKFPNDSEPVIFQNVDEIMVVCGLHALGKKAVETVHRLELAPICWEENAVITAEHIQLLIRKGYVEPLKEKYPEKKITICPRHDSSLYQRAVSSLLKSETDVSILKEEWFLPQPKLIICGGGHVSHELVQIAAYLDFYIKVIDDREEFANKERFPAADEVICDSFEHLENYMEPNAYYVVVTRGHKDDFQCVKKILNGNYQYLGMIGSRLKVQKTFENLEKEGVTKEQLATIFAPIGLKIHAVTPAEIAVSILAQIIQEKNKKQVSSVSKELLETREKGVLCIITEKTGSSPRGVGSMMLVTESGVVDSIGGGMVEHAVIMDALECKEVMMKEYQLNNQESESLGMICGGSNKVLFLPISGIQIGCVIMASGLGKRFGSNKLLQEFQGRTLIQRVLDITESLFEKRVVVTRSEEIRELCDQQKVEVIFHSLPDRNDTVRLGIEAMREMDACVFCPSDQPLLKRESIQKLIDNFSSKGEGIHRLVHEQREGTPILFGKEYFEELRGLPEKSGGSYLVKKYPDKVEKVAVIEEIELQDIDTSEDYHRLLENGNKGETSCTQ